jgi:xylulokinase
LRLLASALGGPVGLVEGADLAGPRGAARLAAVAAGAPVSTLSEAVTTSSVVGPDPGLAEAMAARRDAARAMLAY